MKHTCLICGQEQEFEEAIITDFKFEGRKGYKLIKKNKWDYINFPCKRGYYYQPESIFPICYTCLQKIYDNFNPFNLYWVLEWLDYPYKEKNWKISIIKGKDYPSGQFAYYIEQSFNEEYFKDRTIPDTLKGYKGSEQFPINEITEESNNYKEIVKQKKSVAPNPTQQIINIIKEQEELLTKEEKKTLQTKWGKNYSAENLIYLEEMYRSYTKEYSLNADRAEILKKICRCSLAMDQALEEGDSNTYKNLASTFDQLRKSGKFTEAQISAEEQREIDSIGQLVSIVEREGGIIKNYADPDDYPQDKIDYTIKNLKEYNFNLLMNEINIGQIIETYLSRLEDQQQRKEAQNKINPEEDYAEYLSTTISNEAQELASKFTK